MLASGLGVSELLLEDQPAPEIIRRGRLDLLAFDGQDWWLPYGYPRVQLLFQSRSDYPKVIIQDMIFCGPCPSFPGWYEKYTNHFDGEELGGNVTFSDGATRWLEPDEFFVEESNACAMPKPGWSIRFGYHKFALGVPPPTIRLRVPPNASYWHTTQIDIMGYTANAVTPVP